MKYDNLRHSCDACGTIKLYKTELIDLAVRHVTSNAENLRNMFTDGALSRHRRAL